MINQDVPAYQRLLAAADAIGEVGRAAGQLQAALEHAPRALAALICPSGRVPYNRNAESDTVGHISSNGSIMNRATSAGRTANLCPCLPRRRRRRWEWGLGLGIG
jgi:hypothetical protein